MYQNNDPTGLDAFRQQWQAGSRPSGLLAFLTGQDTSGQNDQGAQANRQALQEAQARARAQVLRGMAPKASQDPQDRTGA